jgi:hypothetical protein
LSFFVVLGRNMMRTSKPKMNIMEKRWLKQLSSSF